MKYRQKKFSVSMGNADISQDNWERTFGKKKPETSPEFQQQVAAQLPSATFKGDPNVTTIAVTYDFSDGLLKEVREEVMNGFLVTDDDARAYIESRRAPPEGSRVRRLLVLAWATMFTEHARPQFPEYHLSLGPALDAFWNALSPAEKAHIPEHLRLKR